MTSGQKSFPVVAPKFKFARHGKAGAWVSELLPHTATVVDDLCIVRSMHTEAINHDPAITFLQTGSAAARPAEHSGRGSSYGLGSEAENLPAFVVLISHGSGNDADQGLLDRLWGSGFLPIQSPGGEAPQRQATRSCTCPTRRASTATAPADARRPRRAEPAAARRATATRRSQTRIAQYEMAFRMQTSVPELTDLSKEPKKVLDAVRPGRDASRARSRPTACWPGGWPSAACGSSSSTTAAGTSTAACRPTSASSARTPTSRRRPWSRT